MKKTAAPRSRSRRARAAAPRLGVRELNRALLERQLLLHRWILPVGDVVDHLLGVQAQPAPLPWVALWSRIEGFKREHLTPALQRQVGKPRAKKKDAVGIVLRYLAAFGPASVKDASMWSGLPGLGEIFSLLRRDLETFRDDAGEVLFDLPEAPRPDPDLPAPVRFLAGSDHVLLAHRDRSRIVPADVRPLMAGANDAMSPFFVDGFLAGSWRIERGVLTLRPGRKLSKPWLAAVRLEAASLLEVAEPAREREVRIVAAQA